MAGPLQGVTILELAAIGPAPFAVMMLADMGAEVLRIDRMPAADSGASSALLRNDGVVDRGRRSVALDMKSPRAIDVVLRLVERADVVIEGFRPGVAEKLGVGPDTCLARNPKLVYGRMTGWGQTGPLARTAGHDLNYIAISGALHAMGPKDRPPPPPLNLVGDYGGGGMLLAVGVLAALFEAQRSGRGQVVDAAMTDGSALLMAMMYGLKAKGFWSDARESNFLDGSAHFYGTYECADGRHVAIGSIEPQFYRQLLQVIGEDDASFARQWSTADWPALRTRLAAVFMTRTRDEWCELFEGSDACFAPVLSMSEAPLHPHNVARGTFVESAGVVQPAPAPRFSRTASELPPAAPQAGDDSLAVLRRAGLAPREIESLLAEGVAHQSA
jgi:alpha-methylacyl-CoA racemase